MLERKLPELQRQLLTLALDGRPFSVHWSGAFWLLRLRHENGQHRIDRALNDEEFSWLLTDLEGFRQRIVEPAVRSLDQAAYPDRAERLMTAARQAAELAAEDARTR
jgi:hypothetical protein